MWLICENSAPFMNALEGLSGVASFITIDEQLQRNRGCDFLNAGFVSYGPSHFSQFVNNADLYKSKVCTIYLPIDSAIWARGRSRGPHPQRYLSDRVWSNWFSRPQQREASFHMWKKGRWKTVAVLCSTVREP